MTSPGARQPLRGWLERFAGCEADFALAGTTGWRFVVWEIERAGRRAHLADPAETAARRGRERRAKTDNADCELQLRLLCVRRAAGVVDPAQADARAAHAGTLAEGALGLAGRLAAAPAGAAVSAGDPARAGGCARAP